MGFRHPVVIINLINLFSFTFFCCCCATMSWSNSEIPSHKKILHAENADIHHVHTQYILRNMHMLLDSWCYSWQTKMTFLFDWFIKIVIWQRLNLYPVPYLRSTTKFTSTNIICQRVSQCLLIFNVQKWKWGIIKEQ